MRSRSGGLHADSPEEFLELAEQTMAKLGTFYDDALNHKRGSFSPKRTTKAANGNKDCFSSFDFNTRIEAKDDEDKLIQESRASKCIRVNIVILCDRLVDLYPHFDRLKPGDISQMDIENTSQWRQDDPGRFQGNNIQKNEPRCNDLVIRKRVAKDSTEYIINYWLMEQSLQNEPLSQIYLNTAEAILHYSQPTNQYADEPILISLTQQILKLQTDLIQRD